MTDSPALAGTPSDEVPAILAEGESRVGTIFLSFSARQPEGKDAEYIEWHSLDHRPEQHRLPALRASLRVASTPECRRARAASEPRFDAVDHLMAYFFEATSAMRSFVSLGAALRQADRVPYLLPSVEMGVYDLEGKMAAGRIKIGSDVLPFRPYRGVYVIVEEGDVPPPPPQLLDVPGLAGAWWGQGHPVKEATADNSELHLTYCFLDGEPVVVAEQLSGLLQKRWANSPAVPLLAAPFHLIVPFEWGRYVP